MPLQRVYFCSNHVLVVVVETYVVVFLLSIGSRVAVVEFIIQMFYTDTYASLGLMVALLVL